MRISIAAFTLFATTGIAMADVSLTVPLDLGSGGSVQSQTYRCGSDEPFAVRYVNAGVNALAILPVDGEERIFVNVVSGSGARYVSGQYVWWTKGDTARLEDEMAGDQAKECTSQ